MAKSRNICESSFDTRNAQPLTTVGHHKQTTGNQYQSHPLNITLLCWVLKFADGNPKFCWWNPSFCCWKSPNISPWVKGWPFRDVTRSADIHLGHHEPHSCAALRSVKWFIFLKNITLKLCIYNYIHWSKWHANIHIYIYIYISIYIYLYIYI